MAVLHPKSMTTGPLKDKAVIGKRRVWLGAILLGMTVLMAQTPRVQAAELLMFESDICAWCDAWHAEIGPIYPKTAEGKRGPLRTVDIHRSSDLDHIEGIRFTPIFVLLDDRGREVGRIKGYPGEDFFWGGSTTSSPCCQRKWPHRPAPEYPHIERPHRVVAEIT